MSHMHQVKEERGKLGVRQNNQEDLFPMTTITQISQQLQTLFETVAPEVAKKQGLSVASAR